MAWTAADIGDLTGRTVVVTGANGGLGLETTRALAGAGAHVVMAARNQEKATSALADVRHDHPDASLEVVPLDLGDLSSVRTAADQILAAYDRIDVLVNNAGVMAMPERRTVDGFEMQLGVDHLGHYAFTAHLLPALLRADRARVVTVTSTARHLGQPIDPENPHLDGRYKPWRSYGQAKLANYWFALGLERKFRDAGANVRSLTAHPGLSNTDLQSTTVAEGGGGLLGTMSETLAERTGMSAEHGARPQLRAATDPAAKGGELYGPRFASNGPAVRLPVVRRPKPGQVDTLWQVSERETGVELDVAKAMAAAGA